jgi:hypothetical protein
MPTACPPCSLQAGERCGACDGSNGSRQPDRGAGGAGGGLLRRPTGAAGGPSARCRRRSCSTRWISPVPMKNIVPVIVDIFDLEHHVAVEQRGEVQRVTALQEPAGGVSYRTGIGSSSAGVGHVVAEQERGHHVHGERWRRPGHCRLRERLGHGRAQQVSERAARENRRDLPRPTCVATVDGHDVRAVLRRSGDQFDVRRHLPARRVRLFTRGGSRELLRRHRLVSAAAVGAGSAVPKIRR